jgi:putative phosphoribosyl transferase
VVVAAPVVASQTAEALAREADEVVAVLLPDDLDAVGSWYVDFGQTSDEEVLAALDPPPRTLPPGDLALPAGARGLVLFAHGSGSGRKSPRNRSVAERLGARGLATFLFDLLTPEEEAKDRETGALRFDVPFLARRLTEAVDAAVAEPRTRGLRVGLFGASTGAAAAVVAAAGRPQIVHAVVSRGGRPDLAGPDALSRLRAPTLLIVGSEDRQVLALNRSAAERLRCPHAIEVVAGAGHLFEEPGALVKVSDLAAGWFARHLA